jgi:hypothetical protein
MARIEYWLKKNDPKYLAKKLAARAGRRRSRRSRFWRRK